MTATALKPTSALTTLANTIRPGSRYGFYPQQPAQELSQDDSHLEKWLAHKIRQLGPTPTVSAKQRQRFIATVNTLGQELGEKDHRLLDQWIHAVRSNLYQCGLSQSTIALAFTTIREIAERVLGMRHYDVQLLGGWAILEGAIAEMQTGEGKTLTATLPACAAAMAGIPVHVVTVNDYLAKRDAELMQPLYQRLGFSVGIIQSDMALDQRRAAYACDITYCTNKQLVFDYLKDSLLLQGCYGTLELNLLALTHAGFSKDKLLLRGLNFAIVDEADSIFIDEARTPLILSQTSTTSGSEQVERQFYQQALQIANQFEEDEDFSVDYKARQVILTAAGLNHIDQRCDALGGIWTGQRRRKNFITLALSSCYLYYKDQHYLVQDNKVQIIDEHTGRIMIDRSWEYGLQQMIEAKEDCDLTPKRETLAQISYQHFFQRYWRLGGMTGTGQETKGELSQVYGLHVVRIPTHKPIQRHCVAPQVCISRQAKWQAVFASVEREHKRGRPILVGTTTVEDSEQLSALLENKGLPHQVLNAKQDQAEADIIALAGQQGCITLATNMAGRGTDIKLGVGVTELGGLHVIACQYSRSRRIDRQLVGRCARQGDPGSVETIVALNDPHLLDYLPSPITWLFQCAFKRQYNIPRKLAFALSRWAQRAMERDDYRQRMTIMKIDTMQNKLLAFAGKKE
ncbi:MAG: preprotein translocase subunit SecA [Pseudomonadales bacterium]